MLPEHFCNSPVDDEFVFSATVSLGLDFSTISDIITLGFGYISGNQTKGINWAWFWIDIR